MMSIAKKYRSILWISILVLGLATTFLTDDFPTYSNSLPSNYGFSADNVAYYHPSIVRVTLTEARGFPFASHTQLVNRYVYEGVIMGRPTLQLPPLSSEGSNSFVRIFPTWEWFSDVAIWSLVWFLILTLFLRLKASNPQSVNSTAL